MTGSTSTEEIWHDVMHQVDWEAPLTTVVRAEQAADQGRVTDAMAKAIHTVAQRWHQVSACALLVRLLAGLRLTRVLSSSRAFPLPLLFHRLCWDG